MCVLPQDAGVPEQDRLATWAQRVASLLRAHPTMPAEPADAEKSWLEVSGGGRLPTVPCAFGGCPWHGGSACEDWVFREDPEHPWDQELRTHVLDSHVGIIPEAGKDLRAQEPLGHALWEVYKEAIAVVERRGLILWPVGREARTRASGARSAHQKYDLFLLCTSEVRHRWMPQSIRVHIRTAVLYNSGEINLAHFRARGDRHIILPARDCACAQIGAAHVGQQRWPRLRGLAVGPVMQFSGSTYRRNTYGEQRQCRAGRAAALSRRYDTSMVSRRPGVRI